MTDPGEAGSSRERRKDTLNTVAILDAGAQYGMDIEQQLKRLGFFAERLPFETPLEQLQPYGGIVLSGGPESVYEADSPACDPRIFDAGLEHPPVLGICYGAHIMNYQLGGKVESLADREDGPTDILVSPDSSIFAGLEPEQSVMMSHGDTITRPAEGFEVTATSGGLIAAIANPGQKLFGLQFHPEVYSQEGPAMLRNFAAAVAGLEADYVYSYDDVIEDAVSEVRQQVKDRQVLAFISGGIDSAALAKLLNEALPPEQVFLAYIDNGFMRQGEGEAVSKTLAGAGINISVIDASEMFINGTTVIDGAETPPLSQVIDPEVKRKIIGDVFIDVKDRTAKEMGLDLDNFMLAMGTLHTDLIESGSAHASGKADVIKSHHNDSAAVRQMRDAGRVVEPWRFLQKDDVRAVGKLLGLPDEITKRQPFPGPGLAIRIICAEEPVEAPETMVEQLAEFDNERLKTALLPILTVGVQGDHRTYGHLAALSGEAPWDELQQAARQIPRSIRGINRVVYLFGQPVSGPVETITRTRVNQETLDQLRPIDHLVNTRLRGYGLDHLISQVPVISFPVNFGEEGKRSIGIRTFMTTNFKTGDIALPGRDFPEPVLQEIVQEITSIRGIARVAYDLTSKPPGTTEWE